MQLTCPILGRPTSVTPFLQRDQWSLVRCQETGFVFLQDPPDYTQLIEEYAWEVTMEKERERRREAEPVRSRLSDWTKTVRKTLLPKRNKMFDVLRHALPDTVTHAKILDIGCGGGEFMADVQARFATRGVEIKPFGIEVSKQLSAEANARFKRFQGSVVFDNAIDGTRHFKADDLDVVVMLSFLEHEAQPLALLRNVHRTLKSNGLLVVKVPNFDCWNRSIRGEKWCGYRYPDHVNYFSPTTLSILANNAGFTLRRQRFSEKSPFNDNMYGVLTKKETAHA